jgi:hypothetical protein
MFFVFKSYQVPIKPNESFSHVQLFRIRTNPERQLFSAEESEGISGSSY